MTHSQNDYDGVAGLYDFYVTADYDVPFFLDEAGRAHGPILELTSGTGRLSLPLIEAGADLTCVDGSRSMLERLARKLEARGLVAEVLFADVCELRLPPSFELAIFPFQTFMEIVGEERQRAALAAICASLVPGGRFVCTLHNPVVRRAWIDGTLRVVGRFEVPEGALVVSGFERGGDPVVERLQFLELFGHDGELLSKQLQPMEFAFIEKAEFESLARGAGFSIVALYGDYDRSPFDPDHSPVMIWTLAKAGSPDEGAEGRGELVI